jgi:hypothetical protein
MTPKTHRANRPEDRQTKSGLNSQVQDDADARKHAHSFLVSAPAVYVGADLAGHPEVSSKGPCHTCARAMFLGDGFGDAFLGYLTGDRCKTSQDCAGGDMYAAWHLRFRVLGRGADTNGIALYAGQTDRYQHELRKPRYPIQGSGGA